MLLQARMCAPHSQPIQLAADIDIRHNEAFEPPAETSRPMDLACVCCLSCLYVCGVPHPPACRSNYTSTTGLPSIVTDANIRLLFDMQYLVDSLKGGLFGALQPHQNPGQNLLVLAEACVYVG